MNRAIPLLGPVWLLYLLAEVASGVDEVRQFALLIALFAVAMSVSPALVRPGDGSKRVGILGIGLGTVAASTLTASPSTLVAAAGAIGGTTSAALLIDLALSVPHSGASSGRLRPIRRTLWCAGLLGSTIGVLAALPAAAPLFEARVHWLPHPSITRDVALSVGIALTLGLRFTRRWKSTAPVAGAANTWSLTGTAIAAVALASAAWVSRAPNDSLWPALISTCGLFALTGGHLAMVNSQHHWSAGSAVRRAVAVTTTFAVVAALAAWVSTVAPIGGGTAALAAVVVLLGASLVYRATSYTTSRVMSPFQSLLIDNIRDGVRDVERVGTEPDFVEVALRAARRGSGELQAEPRLFLVEPERTFGLNAASDAKTVDDRIPEPLAKLLHEQPGDVIVASSIAQGMRGRPQLRDLLTWLEREDILAVVPLVFEGELEGALTIPCGSRTAPLTLEETAGLQRLGLALAPRAALFSRQARASERCSRLQREASDLREAIESLEERLERAQADAGRLRGGPETDSWVDPPIAYGPAMKTLLQRATRLAPLGAPVLITGEAGIDLLPIAYRIHIASGRGELPFVIGNCARIRRERLASLMFGDESNPVGWLRSASNGTLVLLDVPALPESVQRELAEAVATHHVDGANHPHDVRIIATSRVPLDPLAATGTFDAELARWLGQLHLHVPALRERPQDFESHLWLSLDRATRRLGRPALGMEPDAIEILARHDWPGNAAELDSVVERAVGHSHGPRIGIENLPPLVSQDARPIGDPLACTYHEIERKMLVRALERADQNKSEAARLLGLKRTTFLDKLRRQGLHEQDTLAGAVPRSS